MSEPVSLGDLLRRHAARLVAPITPRAPLDPSRLGVPRQPLDQRLRRAILMRDNYTCQWCSESIYCDRSIRLEVDHIVPWSALGSDHPVNLRTLCQPCNQLRSNRLSELDQRAMPIVWRCYSCDEWGDVESGLALFTAYCSTCCATRRAPHVADLMVGGPVPDVGVPEVQDGDEDVSQIPLTVRPPHRRFKDCRERDDRRRSATARRRAGLAAARAELDRIRPKNDEDGASA
jgi:hypothetical protein